MNVRLISREKSKGGRIVCLFAGIGLTSAEAVLALIMVKIKLEVNLEEE
jgi:hypothetical protein